MLAPLCREFWLSDAIQETDKKVVDSKTDGFLKKNGLLREGNVHVL